VSGSDRLGSNWNVDPRLTFVTDTSGSSVAAVSISASSAVRLSILVQPNRARPGHRTTCRCVSQLPSAVRRLLTSTPLLEQLLGKLECWAEVIWYRSTGL
jgi:hypothetical protein